MAKIECKNCDNGYILTVDMDSGIEDYDICSCCNGHFENCESCEKDYWIDRWTKSFPFKFPIELYENGNCKRCNKPISKSGHHICKDLSQYLKEKHKE